MIHFINKFTYFISNKVGITKAESMIVAVLLALLLIGLILLNTLEVTSKELLIKLKEEESIEGTSEDSLTAAQVIKQWQETEHVTASNPFQRNELTSTNNDKDAARTYDKKNKTTAYTQSLLSTGTHRQTSNYSKSKSTNREKLDINRATVEEIIAIKGLGEWTAQQIQILKKENGGKIDSLTQLKKIRGMRDNVYETITRYFDVK